VDGVNARVWRADHAFRAVALPAGRHEIEFRFRPRRLLAGAAISVAAALVVLALLVPRRARTAAVAVGLVVVALGAAVVAPGAAEAALPAPPFDLSVTPTWTTAGDTVMLDVAPRGRADGTTWDLYVLWLYSDAAAFLTPEGAWSPRPVPWRARLPGGQHASAPWPRVGPPDDITLALVVVEPGGDPLQRLTWRFRPALATAHVRGPGPAPAWRRLLGPALVALCAVALVLGVPLSRPRSL
jgi:hypothetical protein